MISTTVLTAGALVSGCGGDPLRNERMTYRPLGKTGLDVSVIGFGGEWMERADQATCTAVTRRCEGRCPFKVKISERMQAAAQLFGC